MRIAIAGTRGIPSNYGGFETFAEELSVRLSARGHQVVVYSRHALCSKRPTDFEFQGVRVRSSVTVMHKYLETPLAALASFVDLIFRRVDCVLLCNAANSPFAWLVRLGGMPLVVNVDGIERRRAKWNILGRSWYRLGELCSVLFASKVVADARVIAEYYLEKYGERCAVIAYGASEKHVAAGDVLARFGLKPNSYILYVARLEPENNCLGVIEGYRQSALEMPLVIVGDAPYAAEYKAQLRAAASDRVIFTGFQFGDAYRELRSNCAMYVQAGEVGGTHPALLEAMAHGNFIIANQVPEHQEVLGDCGVYYTRNDFGELAKLLQRYAADENGRQAYGIKARARAREVYDWERIVNRYENLLQEVARSR